MEEVASTPKLVDQGAADTTGGLTATLPRSEIEAALHDDAGADLFLEIARIQNGERDDRTVKVAWERKDLEDLLKRASGDPVTLTFDQEELERMLDEDVEAHGFREKALVLTIAAATAAGMAGSASAQLLSDGGGGGAGSAGVSGMVTDNSPGVPAGAISGLVTDTSTSGNPDAVRGLVTDTGSEATRSPAAPTTGGGSGFTMPSAAVDAALAGGIALLITGAAFVSRTTRRREQPA
jgi:hypothetical protein